MRRAAPRRFSGGILQKATQGVLHPLHPQVGVREDPEERAARQARGGRDRLRTLRLRPHALLRAIHLVVPFCANSVYVYDRET